MAYEAWLAGNCPRCGTRDEDWFDDDGSPRREPAYQPVARGCQGCEERARHDKHLPDDARDRGIYTALIPADEFDLQAEQARTESLGGR